MSYEYILDKYKNLNEKELRAELRKIRKERFKKSYQKRQDAKKKRIETYYKEKKRKAAQKVIENAE